MISVLILDINEAKENETKENVSKETVSKKLHTCPLPEAEDRDPRLFLLRKGLHFMGADSLAERLTSKMLCLGRDGKPSRIGRISWNSFSVSGALKRHISNTADAA